MNNQLYIESRYQPSRLKAKLRALADNGGPSGKPRQASTGPTPGKEVAGQRAPSRYPAC